MERLIDIIGLLQIIIRLGVACRVVICLLKMNFNNDDGGVAENKMRIKNSLIFLVVAECAWGIKDLIFNYYEIIYIPINIQTETMIFQGYGMSELFKTLAFTAITSVIWIILFIIKHSSIQLAFEIMCSMAVGVFIFVKDTTNQCIVDYIRYMIKFATTQRSYRYNNHIEDEEAYIIKEYKDSLTVEQ